MLKNILKLDGAQQLSKNEQKSVMGGEFGFSHPDCTNPWQGAYQSQSACELACIGSGSTCARVVQNTQSCWVCITGNKQ